MSKLAKARLGDQVGRLMIQDLIELQRHTLTGRSKKKLLSAEERMELVNSLTSPQDLVRYTELRHVHDYLVRSSVMSQLYKKSAELNFWKLIVRLRELQRAETDNLAARFAPPIMTQEQYSQLAPPAFEAVAVIQGPPPPEYVDEKGWYREPEPTWREFMAESFLADRKGFLALLASYQYSLIELNVLRQAVALIGEFIKVKETTLLLAEANPEELRLLSDLMSEIPPTVVRFGRFAGEVPEARLRLELNKLFRSLDPADLEPGPEAVEAARALVDYTIVQGREEELYHVLRRGKPS